MNKIIFVILPLVLFSCKSNNNVVQFHALHESFVDANKLLIEENRMMYQEMEYKLQDPQTRTKALIWHPKGLKLKGLALKVSAFIDSLETVLNQNMNKEKSTEPNSKAVTHLFDGQNKADQLYTTVDDFKSSAIAVLTPAAFSDNPKFQQDLLRFGKQLQETNIKEVNADDLKPVETENPYIGYFKNTSAATAITMLDKIKNDVLTYENRLLFYINSICISSYHGYEAFSALVSQNTTALRAGETLRVYAGIGGFSLASKPRFTINEQTVDAEDGEKAIYELNINKRPGTYSIPVKIEFIKPDGSHAIMTKNIKYTVLP